MRRLNVRDIYIDLYDMYVFMITEYYRYSIYDTLLKNATTYIYIHIFRADIGNWFKLLLLNDNDGDSTTHYIYILGTAIVQ